MQPGKPWNGLPSQDDPEGGRVMRKKTWDLYAPIYKRAMQADQQIYDFIDTILGLLGVAGGIAGTASAFSGAWETLFGAVSTIIEFFSSFLG